jgi:multisubunit Na+/H+ antiporter MnhG subunit
MVTDTPRGARIAAWVALVLATFITLFALVGLFQLPQLRWISAANRVALPVGLFLFATSLIVRSKSEKVGNMFLALSMVLYVVYFWARYSSR